MGIVLETQKKREIYLNKLISNLEYMYLDSETYSRIVLEYSKSTTQELKDYFYENNSRVVCDSVKRFRIIREQFNNVKKGNDVIKLEYRLVLPIMRKVIVNYLRDYLRLKVFSNDNYIIIHNVNLKTIDTDKLNNSLMVALV